MSELTTIFDSLYSRLVLRDVFAKMVPGSVVLAAIATTLTSPLEVAQYLRSMSFAAWLLAASLAWILAFAVQAFGERWRLIKYYPDPAENGPATLEAFYDVKIAFDQDPPQADKQQVERLIVIKEACGNMYIALSTALLLFLFDGMLDVWRCKCQLWPWLWNESRRIAPVLVLTLAAVYYLRHMHFIHVHRQYAYMLQSLAHRRGARPAAVRALVPSVEHHIAGAMTMTKETKFTQLAENMRFYADMRFKQIGVLTAVLTVAAAGAVQFPSTMLAGQTSVRTVLASFALLLTAVVWIMEVRSTLFWTAHRDEAADLWPAPPGAPFPWLTATNALLVLYASVYGFWLFCAVHWKLVTFMVAFFGVLGGLLLVFSVKAYLPLWRRRTPTDESRAA
jgi:hypothetical protein